MLSQTAGHLSKAHHSSVEQTAVPSPAPGVQTNPAGKGETKHLSRLLRKALTQYREQAVGRSIDCLCSSAPTIMDFFLLIRKDL